MFDDEYVFRVTGEALSPLDIDNGKFAFTFKTARRLSPDELYAEIAEAISECMIFDVEEVES